MPIALLSAMAMLVLQRRAPLRLIWRTRFLLLVLLFGYAYSVPGVPMWSLLGGYSPTWEGGWHGVEQAMRLIVLLLWLDTLVLRLPAAELMAGLYQMMQPFCRLGLEPHIFALRLGLTLRAIEAMERGRDAEYLAGVPSASPASRFMGGHLKRLLELDSHYELPQRIQLHLMPPRFLDIAVPGLVSAVLLAVWWLYA